MLLRWPGCSQGRYCANAAKWRCWQALTAPNLSQRVNIEVRIRKYLPVCQLGKVALPATFLTSHVFSFLSLLLVSFVVLISLLFPTSSAPSHPPLCRPGSALFNTAPRPHVSRPQAAPHLRLGTAPSATLPLLAVSWALYPPQQRSGRPSSEHPISLTRREKRTADLISRSLDATRTLAVGPDDARSNPPAT